MARMHLESEPKPDGSIAFRCSICGTVARAPVHLPDDASTPDCGYKYIVSEPLRRIGWEDVYVHRTDGRLAIVCHACLDKANRSIKAYSRYNRLRSAAEEFVRSLDNETYMAKSLIPAIDAAWSHDHLSRVMAAMVTSPQGGDNRPFKAEIPCRCMASGCGRTYLAPYVLPQPLSAVDSGDLMPHDGSYAEGWYLEREMGFAGHFRCPEHNDRQPDRDNGLYREVSE